MLFKMRLKVLILLLAVTSAAACTQPIIDTFGNIGGVVSDAQSGIPLPGVQVLLTPTGYSQVTNADGTFQFDNLDVQEYTLTFTKSGYETYNHKVTVKPGLSSSVQINMHASDFRMASLQMGSVSALHTTWMRLTATLTSTGDTQVTQHGFCFATRGTPTLSDNIINLGAIRYPGSFTALAENLTPKTTYHIRAYAQNGAGVVYSEEVTATTPETGEGGGSEEGIVVPGGLVAYYLFDKADISDCTDNELHGYMFGEPSFITQTPSGEGKAVFLNFNKNQYITVPYNPFKGIVQYSICFWIKDFSTGMIFTVSEQSSSSPRNDYPRLICGSDGRFTFYTGYDNYNSTPSFDYNTSSIQGDGWHHIALTTTVSGNNLNRNLYVDGKLKGTTTLSYGSSSNSAQSVVFGGTDSGKYQVATSMKLDNIRFYTRSLTNDEISAIYASEQ